MKHLIPIILIALSSCNMEYKKNESEVQDYHWIGLVGTEEICNDTIYTYDSKLGAANFTSRIIITASDSAFSYKYLDEATGEWQTARATYETWEQNEIPYMTVIFDNSVSMFTRKKVCPIKFN